MAQESSPAANSAPGRSRSLLDQAAAALVDGVEGAVAAWLTREVGRLVAAWGRLSPDAAAALRAEAADAAADSAARVRGDLAALLAQGPAEQRTTPLELVRSAVPAATAILERAGIPPVVRDPWQEDAWPHDLYGLMPANLRDIDPDLAAVHLAWGFAKAEALREPPAE